jgi:hypothetical protein
MGQGKEIGALKKLSAEITDELRGIKNPNKKLRELLERLERESPEAKAAELARGKQQLAIMKSHPNYSFPFPDYREDSLEFSSRAIGELISPPQQPGESQELECVDIKAALVAYSYELRAIWQLWLLSRRQTVERFSIKKSLPPDSGNGNSALVAVWKLDEWPELMLWQYAEGWWYGSGGKTRKRDYFAYWAPLPNYQ